MARKSAELVYLEGGGQCAIVDLGTVSPEISQRDMERFVSITSTELSEEQREWVSVPPRSYPMQHETLAVHWHPEFVPLDCIARRIQALYPNMQEELIIPTQHNELLSWGEYSGVEVDCYSSGFNRKVQLLLHFRGENLESRGDVLKAMLEHTFKYRSSQLFQYLDALTEKGAQDLRYKAAAATGADAELVEFCGIQARKVMTMLEERWESTPQSMVKNKLLRNFFTTLVEEFGQRVISRAQVYLKAVKEQVKAGFSLKYFYRASEVIEEARSLGAGVVIPHPEQFWPILLANYDVDGYEIWNPQSREYTEFLISVVHRQNAARLRGARPLLVFMGDDCHMGEKTIAPELRDPEKDSREPGLQPAWEDMGIRKNLVISGYSKAQAIADYKARLG